MNEIKVHNRTSITSVGLAGLRTNALDIVEKAIQAADPYQATRNLVHLEKSYLTIGSLEYDLREWNNIYVLGVGKASQGIAFALEEELGDRIKEGLVVLTQGEQNNLNRIQAIIASHPVPDQDSLNAGKELMAIARKASRGDIVFSLITGGSSSLAILPPDRVSLEDVQVLYTQLLSSGASIFEVNAVRKHVSKIKGGRLAQQIFPAEIINLTVSDVVGDKLDYITDLTVPDTSHYQDAWNTLDKYQMWNRIPISIRMHLRNGLAIESPKSLIGVVHTYVVVPGDAAFQGAVKCCKELGYHVHLYPREIEGESRDEAHEMVGYARRLIDNCLQNPCAVIATGETTVTLGIDQGCGGPNQEFSLSAAIDVDSYRDMVVSSIDVDGTDGPTQAAGALVDGDTIHRGKLAGLDAKECLNRHSSWEFLKATNDLIFTGPTGTNVNDIMFILSV